MQGNERYYVHDFFIKFLVSFVKFKNEQGDKYRSGGILKINRRDLK